MSIRVCLAGATGWAGSALARAIGHSNTIELVAAVSRTYAAPTCAALVREAAEVYRRRNLARR